eukprot:scaffold5359_cov131-Isochrysis_galbana.AAC.5
MALRPPSPAPAGLSNETCLNAENMVFASYSIDGRLPGLPVRGASSEKAGDGAAPWAHEKKRLLPSSASAALNPGAHWKAKHGLAVSRSAPACAPQGLALLPPSARSPNDAAPGRARTARWICPGEE